MQTYKKCFAITNAVDDSSEKIVIFVCFCGKIVIINAKIILDIWEKSS